MKDFKEYLEIISNMVALVKPFLPYIFPVRENKKAPAKKRRGNK